MYDLGWTEEFKRETLLRDTRSFTVWDVLTWFVIPLVLCLLMVVRLEVLLDDASEQKVREDLRQYRVGLESGVLVEDEVWDERVLNRSLTTEYAFTDRSSFVLDPWGRPYRLGIYDVYTLYGWGDDVTDLGAARTAGVVGAEGVSGASDPTVEAVKADVWAKKVSDVMKPETGSVTGSRESKSDVLMVVSSSGKLEDDERDNYSMALYVISGEVYACTSGYAKNKDVKLPKIAGLHLGLGGCGDKLIRDKN